ncbi:MAG: Na-translocating system protein MpsC family protein [Solirubrobacteraceae bacterium]|jgi:uncharacterized protein YbcI
MMVDNDRPIGDGLHEQITNALVGIQTRYLGHGPASAATFQHDNVVVTLMQDVLSKAEKILAENGSRADVRKARELYRQEMEGDFRAAVERLTGRNVTAFLGASQLDQDVSAEIFILNGVA